MSCSVSSFLLNIFVSRKMSLASLPSQWRHNERDGVSNHQPHDCLLNRLVRLRSKKTSHIRVTGLCAENSPVTSEFPAHRASETENVSISRRHHPLYWNYIFFSIISHTKQTYVTGAYFWTYVTGAYFWDDTDLLPFVFYKASIKFVKLSNALGDHHGRHRKCALP